MSDETKAALEAGIKSLREKQDALGAEVKEALEKYEGQLGDTGTVANEARDAIKALGEKFEKTTTEIAQQLDAHREATTVKGESWGEQFTKSEGFEALQDGGSKLRLEIKNTVVADANTVFPQQQPGVIAGDFKPLTIRQALMAVPTASNAVNSLREASNTNNAAETAQGAAKPESDVTFEPYNVVVETVAHFIKVSNQLLADAPAVVAYIDKRLRDGLAQKVDAQLLNGNGTTPNLSGLTATGNFTAYAPTAGDLLVDAINRAKYALWATGNVPDRVIVNPADWGAMERTREGAGSGQYLNGIPGMNSGMNPFGVSVVLSANMAAGKFLIGALNTSTALHERQTVMVEMGYVNDDFTKNLVTIRAEERLGLGVERPSGILYGDFTA